MKKHYKPMYVGTQAERIALTLVADAYGSMFWETDTSKWYKWTGAVWERSYTELELQTSGGAQIHWDNLTNVPQLFESNFYPHDDPGSAGGYSALLPDPPNDAEDIDSASVTSAAGEVLIEGYITDELNTILLQGGTWHFYNWNRVDTNVGTNQMVIRVYKRSSVGVETELFNVTTVAITNTTVNAAAVEVMTIQPDFVVDSTDRLLVKYFAKTTSVVARTIYFYHDGTTHYSHVHTPFSMISVASGGSSGVYIAFTSLTDVPNSYAGQTGKVVAVDGTETGLEFIDAVSSFLDLTDTPDSYASQNLKLVRVNTAADALEFATNNLSDLSDVDASALADGQVLVWDSGSNTWIPGDAAGGGGRVLIAEQSPSGTGTVTFDNIPGTYKNLYIDVVCRSTRAANNLDLLRIYFNNDTTASNYRRSLINAYGGSSLVHSTADDSQVAEVPAATAPANTSGNVLIVIPNYIDSTFYQMIMAHAQLRFDTTSTQVGNHQYAVEWENTAAITRIDLSLAYANFVAGSVVRLWGEADSGSVSMALDDLTDVDVPSPSDGQILGYVGSVGLWEAVPSSGDAANITYTPNNTNKWTGNTDPGNVDDALDQLASRVDGVEAAYTIALDDLSDVDVPSPSNGQVLGYVGSVGLWEAVTPTTGSVYVPVAATTLVDNGAGSWGGGYGANVGTYTFRPQDNSNIWPSNATAVIVLFGCVWAAAANTSTLSARKSGAATNEGQLRAYTAATLISLQAVVQLDANGYFDLIVAGANATNGVCRIVGYYKPLFL